MAIVRAVDFAKNVLGGPGVTSSDGHFELATSNEPEAIKALAARDFIFAIKQGKFEESIAAVEAVTAGDSFLLTLQSRPASGAVEIIQQPLRSPTSLGTFDVLLINSSTSAMLVSGGGLSLATSSTDCVGARGPGSADEVATVVQLLPDSREVMTLAADPVFGKLDRATFPHDGLCAEFQFTQSISIDANSMKRVRFDVNSAQKRCQLARYAKGIGPYRRYDASSGSQFVATPRLMHPDLRYYQVDVRLVLASLAPGLPAGQLEGVTESKPGEFPRDVQTLSQANGCD